MKAVVRMSFQLNERLGDTPQISLWDGSNHLLSVSGQWYRPDCCDLNFNSRAGRTFGKIPAKGSQFDLHLTLDRGVFNCTWNSRVVAAFHIVDFATKAELRVGSGRTGYATIKDYKERGGEQQYDVMHIPHDLWTHSVQKICQNCIANIPRKQFSVGGHTQSYSAIRDIANRLDVKIIHSHTHFGRPDRAIPFQDEVMDRIRAKFVYTLHRENGYYCPFITSKKLIQRIDRIIAICEMDMDIYKVSDRTTFIPNTVDVSDFVHFSDVDPTGAATSFRFKRQKIDVDFLNAIAKVPAQMNVYGFMPMQYDTFIRDVARAHSNINIIPMKQHVESYLLGHLMYFYYFSQNDPLLWMDMAPMEAVALGLPLVASRRKVYQEYIRDGYNGIWVDDENSFIDAMAHLFENPDTMSWFRNNAIKHRREIVNTLPSEYDRVYKELLE